MLCKKNIILVDKEKNKFSQCNCKCITCSLDLVKVKEVIDENFIKNREYIKYY